MMSDDDSFLSAYMDGQLDPDQHRWVESALVSQPQLAERLRKLSAVRDLVAGLARDQSVDLTQQVMERIHGLRASPGRVRAWPFGRIGRLSAVSLLATAAGVIMAISLAISALVTIGGPRRAANHGPVRTVAVAKPTAFERGRALAPADARKDHSPLSHTVRSHAVATSAIVESGSLPDSGAVVESSGSLATHDLKHVLQFLDNPNLRRMFLVRNPQDGKGEQQVASVVERTTRYGYFKITVSQGIVIDPRRPGEAAVFALIVNPKELDLLRDQLRVALPDLVEETPVDPVIVTRLAGIGRVQALPPTALADVSIPRADHALLARVGGTGESTGPPDLTRKSATRDRPTIEQERSAPVPAPLRAGPGSPRISVATRRPAPPLAEANVEANARKGDPPRRAAGSREAHDQASAATVADGSERADEQIVVLVWVCKPSR
jgi:anti-sigma factor RsiW